MKEVEEIERYAWRKGARKIMMKAIFCVRF